MKKDLFKVLVLGLAVLGLTPLQSGTASAEGGQVLNIAHPVLQQNWSPPSGRRPRSALAIFELGSPNVFRQGRQADPLRSVQRRVR